METTISVIKTLGIPILSSREVISIFKSKIKALDKDIKYIIMDFDKIEFISRSAADELIKLKETSTRDIVYSGLSNELVIFLRSVAANKAYPIQQENKPQIKKRSLLELLN